MKDQGTFVSIKPHEKTIEVTWSYIVRYNVKDGGRYECYIPSFDIYFGASDEAEVKNKSEAFTEMFFDHFLDGASTKPNYKALVLQLHKLGFRAPMDALVVNQYAKNLIVPAKFKAKKAVLIPDFYDSKTIHADAHLETVC